MTNPELLNPQHAFFRSGATRPEAFRRAGLQALAAALRDHEAELLAALAADLGKSACEAYASELAVVHGEIRHALRHLRAWMKPARRRAPRLVWPSRCSVSREPLGVALIIGPWNYPVQLLLAPLVGAIAAGNCAVLKPSEFAPHTAAVIERMIHAAFPAHYLRVVCGDHETAKALLAERWDKIFFTGGTGTGRAVMAAAAPHLTPVTLELGGKCPCLVLADAPVALAARRIAWGKFMNAGQTCVAPDHVWVDARIAREFIAELVAALRGFYGDDPRQSPDYGRIINRRHFDRLAGYLRDGRPVCGGSCDPESRYMAPTVLTEVAPDSPVMREEIFGPILPVLEFAGLDAVLPVITGRPAPLAIYVFSRDAEAVGRVVAATRSGGVCVNDTVVHITGPDMPFGGVGESGMGAYHGRASFECFSHPRTLMRRPATTLPDFRYPPAGISLKWLKRVLRWLS